MERMHQIRSRDRCEKCYYVGGEGSIKMTVCVDDIEMSRSKKNAATNQLPTARKSGPIKLGRQIMTVMFMEQSYMLSPRGFGGRRISVARNGAK